MDNKFNYEVFEKINIQTSSVDYNPYQNIGLINNTRDFVFAYNDESNIHVFTGKLNSNNHTSLDYIKELLSREKFYITAIQNLIKQKKYLNLVYELSNELIDPDEFDKELEDNESEYLINVNDPLDTFDRMKTLVNALNKIDCKLFESDLMEIFSIQEVSLNNRIKEHFYKLNQIEK